MTTIKTDLDSVPAARVPVTPRSDVPRSNVQSALEYVEGGGGGGGGAPTDSQYLVSNAASGLSNERVVSDSSTIAWDFSGIGTATAALSHLGIEDLADPGGDRGAFWDDSEGAVKWFGLGRGLSFEVANLAISDERLGYLMDTSFSAGDVLWFNGTNFERVPAGTDGQFLRTRGAGGTAPDWQNISGGGDLLSGNNLSDLDDAATARSNLGVVIGTDVQAYDASLASLATLATTADRFAYTAAANAWAESPITAFGRNLIDDADASAGRTTLGLGTMATETAADYLTTASAAASYQPLDGDLTAIAALTPSNDDFLQRKSGAWANRTVAQVKTDLGLSGTNSGDQTITLTGDVTGSGTGSFAATIANDAVTYAKLQNVSATDRVLGRSTAGAGDVEEIPMTAFGRNLIDDADAAAGRSTLGLGTMATETAADYLTTASAAASYQSLDGDLTAIAALTPSNDDFLQRKSGAWANRTVAQVKTDLGLSGTNSGDQTITLTGDVTGSGTGSFAATIANDAVTYAKLQNVSAASKLLGRGDSGAGDAQEITLGTGLTMTGTTLSASGGGAGLVDADYGDITVSSSGTVMTIDNDAVTYAKLQNVSATDRVLGRSTAGAGDVEEIPLTAFGRNLIDDVDASAGRTTLGLGTMATETAADYLTTASAAASYQPLDGDLTAIAALTPSNDDFLQRKAGAWANRTVAQVKTDLGLSGTNSGDQTITLTGDVTGSGTGSFAATIANDAVTYAKMQNVAAASKLLGRGDSGSGDVQEITLGSGLTMTGTTISTSGGTGWTTVVKATDESVTSSTALQDDDALQFSMSANTKYVFRMVAFFHVGNASADFKWRHTGPASPTLVGIKQQGFSANELTTHDVIGMVSAYSSTDNFQDGSIGVGTVILDGVIHNGANAGSFKFQWAQTSSNATATKVLAGSYIEYREL